MMTTKARNQKILGIIRVSSGNFLEMYDFIVYGYYASYIAKTFFPSGSEYLSLMLSLVTFGAGFMMRPFGALILGAYIDRKGRREGLLLTLVLMAIGTLSIAVTPGYSSIGIAAPIIIVVGRLLQGFSAGAQLGGVSVYLAEIATIGNRGFYCAWQSASQQVAVVFTAVVGLMLTGIYSDSQMQDWAWRIPLIIGCLIIPIILWLRQSLEETASFEVSANKNKNITYVIKLIMSSWKIILIGMMLTVLTTIYFYLITVYTPTFGKQALHLNAKSTFFVTLCVGLSNFILLPIAGSISDKIGRRPLLIIIPLITLVTAYPVLLWLIVLPTTLKLLAAGLWFSCLYGFYNGAMIPLLTEIMPPEVRTTGFSIAYSLATALFGGFTPAICTYLIVHTNNKASPGLWLMFGAIISIIGVLLTFKIDKIDPKRSF